MSKEETMVERVARAMCVADGANPDHQSNDPFDEGVRLWTTYVPMAKAAIDALEHPTHEMVEEGIRALFATYSATGGPMVTNAYRAMLSKAKEGTGE